MKIAEIRKAIIAGIGVAVTAGIAVYQQEGDHLSPQWNALVLAVLTVGTAVVTWAIPNKPPEQS